ncbi:papain fold toxin domain-containing protein [Anabaena sp. PCC 7108]|uniref:papain fold toxin domain-containing protein n=1 Tax=Anabaena sp. PCC 7108 TaxID=163908 RepID=UPI001181919F|nr:papain fold toxin domain-containing protein [Anabaena sp. PCC 7108]
MSQLSDEEIFREIGKIIQKFDLYQCDDCARVIYQWLKENNIKAKILKLKTKSRNDEYILSWRLERQDITDSITDNGTHYGVEVLDRVFDNLSVEGMTREDWVNDFDCLSHEFTITEIDLL